MAADMTERADVKQERVELRSRWRNGVLMYPGVSVLTWIRIGATWHLANIEAAP